MLLISAISIQAVTYYIIDDYVMTDIDNSRSKFCGYNSDSNTLTIPDSVGGKTIVVIDGYALYDNSTLESIDLSNAVHISTVGRGAFQNCTALKSIVIPAWMHYLSDYLFTNCSSLESCEILSDTELLGDYMFYNCSSLEEFVVPDSVKKISKFAFANCSSLQSVTIPESVTTIAVSAFNNSPNVTLKVWKDSYAYNFAIQQGLSYVLLDEVLLGDVDLNGYVDIRDVTEIQKCLAELREPLDELALMAGDVNGEGNVDISDATSIQLFLAELDFTYPIGQIIS